MLLGGSKERPTVELTSYRGSVGIGGEQTFFVEGKLGGERRKETKGEQEKGRGGS